MVLQYLPSFNKIQFHKNVSDLNRQIYCLSHNFWICNFHFPPNGRVQWTFVCYFATLPNDATTFFQTITRTMKTTRRKTLEDRRLQRCHQNGAGLPTAVDFINLTAQTVFPQGKTINKLYNIMRGGIVKILNLYIIFYVLTCITSFQYLYITCNAFIACYIHYMWRNIWGRVQTHYPGKGEVRKLPYLRSHT